MISGSPTPGAPAGSRLDPEPVTRRDVLGLSALWAAGATLLFALLGILRLPKAAVLPSPSKRFRVALPGSLADREPFVPPGRPVALFREAGTVYAISMVCTHLGCIVKPSATGFDCPCHGSRFAPDGAVIRGPAPKALPWLAVAKAGDDAYTVDQGTVVEPGTKETA